MLIHSTGKFRLLSIICYYRHDGTGRGRRGDRKQGFGRGGAGERPDQLYKRKGGDAEEFEHDVTPERGGRGFGRGGRGRGRGGDRKDHHDHHDRHERKEHKEEKHEEKEEEKEEVVEEIIGYSLDEVLAQRGTAGARKEARAPEGVKGQKVQALEQEKQKKSTVLQNQYAKDTLAKVPDANNVLFGFSQVPDDDDDRRGGRRGDRRGGHHEDAHGHGKGGRRQNAKKALKITDEDFPSL